MLRVVAQSLSAAGEAEENDPDIFVHGKQHLAQDFGLRSDIAHAGGGDWGEKTQSVQTMQAIDQSGDLWGELLLNPFLGAGMELMHRKKQSSEARAGVEAQRGRNQGHAETWRKSSPVPGDCGVYRFNAFKRVPDACGISRATGRRNLTEAASGGEFKV
jgi:hypothetical protein